MILTVEQFLVEYWKASPLCFTVSFFIGIFSLLKDELPTSFPPFPGWPGWSPMKLISQAGTLLSIRRDSMNTYVGTTGEN